MKEEIIKKLKAFILDSAASEGEQNNAIRFLLAYKAKGFDVGEIPEPVRPKRKAKYEKIETSLKVYERVFTSLKETHYYSYICKKIRYERMKKSSFKLPMFITEGESMPGKITVEKETVYRPIFYKYKETYIRFDKVGVDDFLVKEKGIDFHVDTELLEESESPIAGIEWDERCFDEYFGGTLGVRNL